MFQLSNILSSAFQKLLRYINKLAFSRLIITLQLLSECELNNKYIFIRIFVCI